MSDAPITLGPCHYDIEETAVAVAVHSDGEGWIPVCDDHKSKAEDEGYTIRPDVNEAPSDEDEAARAERAKKDPTQSATGDGDDESGDDSSSDDKSGDDESGDKKSDDDKT
jgi:hypothetical protein